MIKNHNKHNNSNSLGQTSVLFEELDAIGEKNVARTKRWIQRPGRFDEMD